MKVIYDMRHIREVYVRYISCKYSMFSKRKQIKRIYSYLIGYNDKEVIKGKVQI